MKKGYSKLEYPERMATVAYSFIRSLFRTVQN
nr:MAG TPA: hypothetical protein [Caudoviricetes sp.]